MKKPQKKEITLLLENARAGSEKATAKLMNAVYDELKGLAHSRAARQGNASGLRTTEIVHESWLRLADSEGAWENRAHFFGAAARAMRNVLVDAARRARSLKRDAGTGPRDDPDEVVIETDPPLEDVLTVDEALTRLESDYPRPARVVDLRYFAGLSMPDIAETIGVSLATAERDWRFARSWLQNELERENP